VSERSSDINLRIGTVRQLSVVITAMRGIAAARSREARGHLDGIRAHTAIIANAIGYALTRLPSAQHGVFDTKLGGHAVVAFCAEQGFVGTFNERILDAAQSTAAAAQALGQPVSLLVLGSRGLTVAVQRGLAAAWSAPMIAHIDEAVPRAGQIIETLYERLQSGDITHVTVIHAAPTASAGLDIAVRRLVPFDFSQFPSSPMAVEPLLTLPPQVLLARLAEEYIFATICEAVVLSFAAENEARTRAMIAARTNVSTTLEHLISASRLLRQEEITDEIIELSSGARP
jgi:F-type H+-transporting ATPase subunit gamma